MENKFNNFSYEELLEKYLDENLPRDLAKAYANANGYESQRNPYTLHTEIGRPRDRRSVRYDYGKANYEVISADEATQYIKQNKENCQNLRILFNGDLVELELRNNGNIYPIYGSGDSVEIDGKYYKNIRYVPWRKILANADKIYKTDEYDHLLYNDPEVEDKRREKGKFSTLGKMLPKDDPDFDPHKAYDNFMNDKAVTYVPNILDTGSHSIEGWFKSSNISNYTLKSYFRKFINAFENKKAAYIKYNNVRKALIKLLRDRDDYDEEEFSEKLEDWKNKKQQYLDNYNSLAKEFASIKAEYLTYIDKASIEANERIQNYLRRIQDALDRGFKLKKKYERMLTTSLNIIPDSSDDRDLYYIARNIKDLKHSISQILKDLQQDKLNLEELTDQDEIDSTNASIESKIERLDSKLSELDEETEKSIDRHLKVLSDIETQMTAIDAELAELQPKSAAAKAERAAKNKKAELDPQLVDIVDFTSFTAEA